MNRRQFLAASAVAVTAALAGCSGGGGTDASDATAGPTTVVGAYVGLGTETPTSEDLERLLHPESPIDPTERAQASDGTQRVDGVDWSIVDRREDLSESELETVIRERDGLELDEEAIETVAAQDNELVELRIGLTVETGEEPETGQSDQMTEVRMYLLVAEEDGQWLVVDDSLNIFSDLESLRDESAEGDARGRDGGSDAPGNRG